jgi:hypothetical protein
VADLSFLPQNDVAVIEDALGALRRGLGETLRSASLVGAAVPPPRHQGARRLELLVVVADLHVAALSNLARELRAELRAAVRLHVLTERELLRAADVFTLELADYRARHLLLLGRDPFGELHYTGAELRGSLEHALRRIARRLREGVLSGSIGEPTTAAGGQSLVEEGIDVLGLVAPHALAFLGEPVPEDEAGLLSALARRAGTDPRPLLAWVQMIREDSRHSGGIGALADLLEVVEAAIALVDTVGANE